MFDHILQKTRTIYWQYGNVTCAGYPLDDIDTIGKGWIVERHQRTEHHRSWGEWTVDSHLPSSCTLYSVHRNVM